MSIRKRIIKIDANGRSYEYKQLWQDLRKNRNVWKIRKIWFNTVGWYFFSTSKRTPVVALNIPTRYDYALLCFWLLLVSVSSAWYWQAIVYSISVRINGKKRKSTKTVCNEFVLFFFRYQATLSIVYDSRFSYHQHRLAFPRLISHFPCRYCDVCHIAAIVHCTAHV